MLLQPYVLSMRLHRADSVLGAWAQSYLSMEAIYPFAIGNRELLYHAPSNITLIHQTLNWLKRCDPIIVLPLLGLWLRTIQEPVFERRKATLYWTYTALLNAGSPISTSHARFGWNCGIIGPRRRREKC